MTLSKRRQSDTGRVGGRGPTGGIGPAEGMGPAEGRGLGAWKAGALKGAGASGGGTGAGAGQVGPTDCRGGTRGWAVVHCRMRKCPRQTVGEEQVDSQGDCQG